MSELAPVYAVCAACGTRAPLDEWGLPPEWAWVELSSDREGREYVREVCPAHRDALMTWLKGGGEL